VETELVSARNRSAFVNGLAIGVGIAFLATFVIVWVSAFFGSQLSPGITYEKMISVFIYPLIFLLASGTALLTAGIVREYGSPF